MGADKPVSRIGHSCDQDAHCCKSFLSVSFALDDMSTCHANTLDHQVPSLLVNTCEYIHFNGKFVLKCMFIISVHVLPSDAKTYGKVCLSPQRRSFGGGCSWKDASSSTNTTAVAGGGGGGKDGQTTPSASNGRDPHFEGSSDSRRPSGWILYYIYCVCYILHVNIM